MKNQRENQLFRSMIVQPSIKSKNSQGANAIFDYSHHTETLGGAQPGARIQDMQN